MRRSVSHSRVLSLLSFSSKRFYGSAHSATAHHDEHGHGHDAHDEYHHLEAGEFPPTKSHYKYLIVGAGTGGSAVGNQLKKFGRDVGYIDPGTVQWYEPGLQWVGAGLWRSRAKTIMLTHDCISPRSDWIFGSATKILPDENAVETTVGKITYEYLVLAPGVSVKWDKVQGLKEALDWGDSRVYSIFSPANMNYVWNAYWRLPDKPINGPVICAAPSGFMAEDGAGQSICLLGASWHHREGKRRDFEYITGNDSFFPVEHKAVDKSVQKLNIAVGTKHELIAVDRKHREATFKNLTTGSTIVKAYDILHVVPPMAPHDFVKSSPLANADGYVDVDPSTLQSKKYKNIFSLGKSAALPVVNSSMGTFAQATVVAKNLLAAESGKSTESKYDGFSMSLVNTERGRVAFVEGGYPNTPLKDPYWMFGDPKSAHLTYFYLSKYVVPWVYWDVGVRGTYGKPGSLSFDAVKAMLHWDRIFNTDPRPTDFAH